MNAVDAYLAELRAALRVRGAARRRFLRECRDHLIDAASERGPEQAVRAFGQPSEIAAEFDAEVAAARGLRSTVGAAAGVVATGGSTLALIHAATPHAKAPTWAVVAFFVAAQLAAVAGGLAVIQALVLRRSTMSPADLVLLSRRNACALVAAGLTMFAAGAATPGRGSAVALLAGPVLVCVAIAGVLRAGSLARRLDRSGSLAMRQPLADLAQLIRLPVPSVDPSRLLALTTCAAAAAAFLRDRAEHATAGQALITAGIEATAVVGCFLLLGRPLGLWRR